MTAPSTGTYRVLFQEGYRATVRASSLNEAEKIVRERNPGKALSRIEPDRLPGGPR